MEFVKWIILALVPFLLGVSVVNYLTVHPLRMSLHLLASCILFFIVAVVLAIGFSGQQFIIAVPLAALAFLVGYYVMTRRFLAREDQRPIPELTRKKGDPGKGHTAIIYFTHGEPELYDPIGWINQFKEFDEQNIPFVPLLARPFADAEEPGERIPGGGRYDDQFLPQFPGRRSEARRSRHPSSQRWRQ
jgi:uncharacterized membrane protein YqaE (UPF0057 family)